MSHVLFFFPLYMKCYVTTQCYLLLLILHHSRELKCTFNMTKKFIHGKNIHVKHQIKLGQNFLEIDDYFLLYTRELFIKFCITQKLSTFFYMYTQVKKIHTSYITQNKTGEMTTFSHKIIACNMYTSEHLNDSVLFTGTHIPI